MHGTTKMGKQQNANPSCSGKDGIDCGSRELPISDSPEVSDSPVVCSVHVGGRMSLVVRATVAGRKCERALTELFVKSYLHAAHCVLCDESL